jgi:hypothetical protein
MGNDFTKPHSRGWTRVMLEWAEQGMARFGQRAHSHFGRGFVLVDPADGKTPVYVTQMAGAPPELFRQVQEYQPEFESVLVRQDDESENTLIVRRVKIERQQ